MTQKSLYKAGSLSVRNQNSLEINRDKNHFKIRDGTREIVDTLGCILLHYNHNISPYNLDTIHTDSLCNSNILYSLPESRDKFLHLSNNLEYFRMSDLIIATVAFVYILVLSMVLCILLLIVLFHLRCQRMRLNYLL